MSYDLDVIRKRRKTLEGRAKLLFNNAKDRARRTGKEFDLTEEWIIEILKNGICQATGIPFDLEQGDGQGQGRAWGPSLDRIDNSEGYTKDNTQVVCWIYNRAKGVGSHSDVVTMAEALRYA
jgi:hypothetical protein